MDYNKLPEQTTVSLTRDQICALHQLLELVHYDNVASVWLDMLPEVLHPEWTMSRPDRP